MTATTPLDLPIDETTLDILEPASALVHRAKGMAVRRALLLADLVGLVGALLIAEFVLTLGQPKMDHIDQWVEVSLLLVSLPVWVVMAKLYGLYDHDEERTNYSTADDVAGVFNMVTAGTWVVFVFLKLTGLADPNLEKVATFWIVAIGLVAAARAGARAFCRTRVAYLQNTVIVGAGDVGQTIARKFLHHPEYGDQPRRLRRRRAEGPPRGPR